MIQAEGIIAVGKAKAEVEALKRDAMYAGESGAWRAKVRIAELTAEKLSGMLDGVKVVPEKTVLKLADDSGLTLNLD